MNHISERVTAAIQQDASTLIEKDCQSRLSYKRPGKLDVKAGEAALLFFLYAVKQDPSCEMSRCYKAFRFPDGRGSEWPCSTGREAILRLRGLRVEYHG